MKKIKFKIGDTVRIIDGGACYDSYHAWAIKHKMKYWKKNTIGYGELPDLFTVIKKGEHGSYNHSKGKGHHIIYGIENNNTGTQHIMGARGLELVAKETIDLPNEWFDI